MTGMCQHRGMALFQIKGGLATQLLSMSSHPAKEKGLQGLIEANLEPLFGVRFVATEFSTGQKHRGRIDTLGLDQDGSPVIVEYKLTSHDNVINQGLFYLDWLMDRRGDFELAVQSKIGETHVTWDAPRLILLAGSFSRYDQYAVNRIDERIELWTYTLYEQGLLAVDLLSREEVPNPKESGAAKVSGNTSKVKSVTASKPTYDVNHHVSKMSPATQALFALLRDEIINLGDDVTERFLNQYIGYRRLKNFAEVVGLRGKLNVFIDGPVRDDPGICQDVSNIGHWGTGHLRATVASENDIEAVLPLIAQAYALQE